MGWNEIWSRPVAVQVADELAFYRERFEFILEDLEAFDPERPLILEGAAFLPELISRYKPNRSQRSVHGAYIRRFNCIIIKNGRGSRVSSKHVTIPIKLSIIG